MPAALDDLPADAGLREALLGDPAALTAPINTLRDKYELLPAFLAVRGLVKQHIDSFNYLVEHDVRARAQRARGAPHAPWRLHVLTASTPRRCAKSCRPRRTRRSPATWTRAST
jgi:DNA-directed RNA polymerase beta subunit